MLSTKKAVNCYIKACFGINSLLEFANVGVKKKLATMFWNDIIITKIWWRCYEQIKIPEAFKIKVSGILLNLKSVYCWQITGGFVTRQLSFA